MSTKESESVEPIRDVIVIDTGTVTISLLLSLVKVTISHLLSLVKVTISLLLSLVKVTISLLLTLVKVTISLLLSLVKVTGLSIEMGENSTQIVPIYEGYSLVQDVSKMIMTTVHICKRGLEHNNIYSSRCEIVTLTKESKSEIVTLTKESKSEIVTFTKESKSEIVTLTKESKSEIITLTKESMFHTMIPHSQVCPVALPTPGYSTPEEESLASYPTTTTHTLPSGEVLTIPDRSRYNLVERYFNPVFAGSKQCSLQLLTQWAINKSDHDIRDELAGNVCLGGGGSLIRGMGERLRMEVGGRVEGTVEVVEGEKDGAWRGGAVMGALESFKDCWITKGEYDDNGPGIVHRKCHL
eukprot:sb/3466127/